MQLKTNKKIDYIFETTNKTLYLHTNFADMVKLVDMPDLGSGAARRVGSSPIIRTNKMQLSKI